MAVLMRLYQGSGPMVREPDVALLMTASGLNTNFANEFFSVIFYLPDYKAISNTM